MSNPSIFETFECPPLSNPICRISGPISLSQFKFLKNKGEPFILENIISDWPAMEKWNFDYFLEVMAERTVPVEIGEKYTDDNWGQQLVKFKNFVENMTKVTGMPPGEKGEISYLAQHPLLEQIPELENDIIIPGTVYG